MHPPPRQPPGVVNIRQGSELLIDRVGMRRLREQQVELVRELVVRQVEGQGRELRVIGGGKGIDWELNKVNE